MTGYRVAIKRDIVGAIFTDYEWVNVNEYCEERQFSNNNLNYNYDYITGNSCTLSESLLRNTFNYGELDPVSC